MQPDEKLALSNCEREQVHIPGRIQSFGALLAFDLPTSEIVAYSDNLPKMFPGVDAASIGQNYETFFQCRETRHAVRGGLGLPSIRNQRERIGVFEVGGVKADLGLFVIANTAVIEFETATQESGRPQSSVSMVRSMLTSLESGCGVQRLLDSAVVALRTLTGFDRVMAYRFLENGDGEVAAEALGNGIESYRGLRYPASDIPQIVRQIALRSPIRIINHIEDQHAALITAAPSVPLDLTLSHLRGVSPIHLEYLRNMGVAATMNTSIVVRSELWGLFAFHHYRKRYLSPDRRGMCELFSQMVAMQVQIEEERELLAHRQQARTAIAVLEDSSYSPKRGFSEIADDLLSIASADGAALVEPDNIFTVGEVPADSAIRAICQLSDDDVFLFDSLVSTALAAEERPHKTAGAMILRLQQDVCLVFFRNQVIQEVRWAGGPEKTITVGPNGPRLNPRASFEEYRESVTDRCKPWSHGDSTVANEVRRAFIKLTHSSSSELSRVLEKQKKQQDLLIAELNHRVRNTLALVRSIARQTKSSTTSLDQYIDSLEQRITALSATHNLLGDSGMQWARIDQLLELELKPYVSSRAGLSFSGPVVAIRADIAPIVSLLFHEIVSNAVKHGALSDNGLALDVSWTRDAGGVRLRWRETLRNPVQKPTRRGFGNSLIERAIPYQCNGRSEITYEGNQLTIDFWLPPDTVVRVPNDGNSVDPLSRHADSQPALRKRLSAAVSTIPIPFSSACILEDNLVLAMEMERMLRELGVTELDSFSTAQDAHEQLAEARYDFAVLDVHLGRETSFELASELQRLKVPVIFVTGYEANHPVPDALADLPCLTKPVDHEQLKLAILALSQRAE